MSSATRSCGSTCLQWTFPCWVGDPPIQKKPSDKVSGDWALIKVNKKVFKDIPRAMPELKLHEYCMEVSTGDLYAYRTGRVGPECCSCSEKTVPWNETRAAISAKCCAIFIATFFYIPIMMAINLVRIVYDIFSIAKSVLADFKNSIKNGKGVLPAVCNGLITLAWKIPSVVMEDIWRVVRAPFYGIGLLFGSLYGILFPLEGRRWISEVENKLHEGAPALQHAVAFKFEQGYFERLQILASKISWDTPLYLAWCMQKRGNIDDQVRGENKFEYV